MLNQHNSIRSFAIPALLLGISFSACQAPEEDVVLSDGPVLVAQKIAFISRRDGNTDIYIMDADGSNEQRLTTNPEFDWLPRWKPALGVIMYSSMREDVYGMYRMNPDGTGKDSLHTYGLEEYLISPDGGKVLFTGTEGEDNREIYIANADGSNRVNLSNHPSYDGRPLWSPSSDKVLFVSDRDGNNELYTINPDGTELLRLTTSDAREKYAAWSPDGSRIAFTSERDGGPEEIYLMNVDGSSQTRLTNNTFYDGELAWSPDGQKLAFHSNRDGDDEIYVMNIDGTAQIRLTNREGYDGDPAWIPIYE